MRHAVGRGGAIDALRYRSPGARRAIMKSALQAAHSVQYEVRQSRSVSLNTGRHTSALYPTTMDRGVSCIVCGQGQPAFGIGRGASFANLPLRTTEG
jgi:hypothetical protein